MWILIQFKKVESNSIHWISHQLCAVWHSICENNKAKDGYLWDTLSTQCQGILVTHLYSSVHGKESCTSLVPYVVNKNHHVRTHDRHHWRMVNSY